MIEQIRPLELSSWLSRHRGEVSPVVLDVREPSEWRTASVQPGDFTLLNMSMGTVPARLQELDPRTPIACLCHHGGRSMQVAQFLVNQGFAQVANIAGGIDAWAVELDGSIPRY
ncbi:MAG: rhodanese-like domain-containing protein [Burkholderiaceae bacterium]|nr:sulfurtransferase [Rhodoferax sp.]MCB2004314.1 sulfurtransferase [Rhodoferax sp.]MCB2028642.1 sulfurtransferase [Rhodoferax sp.]MCB2040377.1 sulfurtransferase [Rhodoferax sp.]MCW5627695.1 sulfurtransferase [Rhodoferax sp.]